MENKEVLLKLLRIGLGKESDVSLPICSDWKAVQSLSFDQGVGGVSINGLKKVFEYSPNARLTHDPNQHTMILMEWYGYVNLAENRYQENIKDTEELGRFFSNYDIPVMLLKGYGLSLNYPVPSSRPIGDIDLYFMGRWKEADELVSTRLGIEIDNSHHHHTVYSYKNQSVENHYDFVNVHSHRSSKKIEEHFKALAIKSMGSEVLPNIYLPSPLLEVEYTARHAACHFASGEMRIRQMLDWLLLVEKESSFIDWPVFWKDIRWMGMEKFIMAMVNVGVKHLGFDISKFHISSDIDLDNVLAERMLKDILHPKFTDKAKKGFFPYISWILKRWWANRWRHEMVYSDSLIGTFFVQMWSHILKPTTLYKK